jgi:3-methyladenine DNA glycosylase AlkC
VQPLKDQFFNKDYVTTLAADITQAAPDFDTRVFVSQVLDRQWKNRELKDRMHHIADTLFASLERDFRSCIKLLTPIVQTRIKNKTNSFGDMIFPDFVGRYGLDDFKTSVKALEVFTAACSSEFAVRPFIVRYPREMMKVMQQWSMHKSEHVRRLASEGCRPRLPWAMALPEFKKDPQPVLKILENLKSDSSEYVRRSVANNLNDISKDNLELALTTAEKWLGKSPETDARGRVKVDNRHGRRSSLATDARGRVKVDSRHGRRSSLATDALVRHALRNELKKGNPRALKLFALAAKTKTKVRDLKVTPKEIKIGEAVRIEFAATAFASERLRLEYWVFFVKSGGVASKKVFHIAEREFAKGTIHEFSKKHRFQNFTTRKHYAGAHKIVVAINGEAKAETTVQLRA